MPNRMLARSPVVGAVAGAVLALGGAAGAAVGVQQFVDNGESSPTTTVQVEETTTTASVEDETTTTTTASVEDETTTTSVEEIEVGSSTTSTAPSSGRVTVDELETDGTAGAELDQEVADADPCEYRNHGHYVSDVAHTHPGGQQVAAAARTRCDEPAAPAIQAGADASSLDEEDGPDDDADEDAEDEADDDPGDDVHDDDDADDDAESDHEDHGNRGGQHHGSDHGNRSGPDTSG